MSKSPSLRSLQSGTERSVGERRAAELEQRLRDSAEEAAQLREERDVLMVWGIRDANVLPNDLNF